MEPKKLVLKEWNSLQQTGIGSILKDPGSSPWPIWGSSILCLLNTLPSHFIRNSGLPPAWALCFLSGVYGGCGILTSHDPDLGSSVSTAWSLIYLITFSKSLKSPKLYPKLSFGYIGLTCFWYSREMFG